MPSAAIASATNARCRSLPTRLRMTPAMRTAGSCVAKPRTTAAADCACRATSSTSTTGRPKCAARSAPSRRAARLAPATPSNRPMTPSITNEIRAVGSPRAGERVEKSSRHRPAIEIDARRAGDRGMESRIDVIRPGFRRAHDDATPRAAPPSSASVTVVLPAPECGAAMMSPRAVMSTLAAPPRRSTPSSCCAPVMTMAPARTKGWPMERQERPLRRGWTTGTCATAAAKAAFAALVTGEFPDPVEVTLPRGERPELCAGADAAGRELRDRRRHQGCRRRPRRDPRRADLRDGACSARRAPASPSAPARASAR